MMWQNYEIASRCREESKEFRTATLLTCIGQEALEVYDGLAFESEAQKMDIDVILLKLEEFCVGATNEIYERYRFNKRDQEAGESIESYLASLRSLAKSCNYGELTDSLIRDRIVVGIRENNVRKKLLQENKLTLAKCINICRANEKTSQQLKAMSQESEDVNSFQSKAPKSEGYIPKSQSKGRGQTRAKPIGLINCKFCGRTHPKRKEDCPSWGKNCVGCGEKNHFIALCPNVKSRKQQKSSIHAVDFSKHYDEASDSDDYTLVVESVDSVNVEPCPKKIFANMQIHDTQVRFQLDCGATVNTLPVDMYKRIFHDPELKQMQHSEATLIMFNHSELKPLGRVQVETINPKNEDSFATEYTIVPQGHRSLLGAKSIQQFRLMTVNVDNIMAFGDKLATPSELLNDYKDVFSGEGKLEGYLHLEVDTSVAPVVLPVRKVPLALKEPVKKELDRLVGMGVLRKVDSPTSWTSAMVVARKRNGKIRLCIDPKPLNKALKRNLYPLPVLDDLLPQLAQAKVFSVVDAKNGFWHVQLDNESSYLTTFGTPWGRFRWTRMPFGISPAPEEFQRRLDRALEGLEGVVPIFDDILIFGVGETEATATLDHDQKLKSLLERCRSKGIRLNKDKVTLRQTEVSFMGHRISTAGLKTDPAKVQGIVDMPTPKNKHDVKRVLGMTNYLQKFAPNLSAATAPMRELLKERNHFQWDEQVQGQSFEMVKRLISQAPVLKFFDPTVSVELQCDASDKGLGACLLQEGQPVAYASRSLTDTEVAYAQIEKETLAIVFAAERFEQFIYGRPVKVDTDHKPLETIFKKNLNSAPRRLQRMLLRLQKFDLTVSYKKGTEMYLADALSRAFTPRKCANAALEEDVVLLDDERGEAAKDAESINMAQYLPVSEATQTALRAATESDPDMKLLKTTIREGWPSSNTAVPTNVREYFNFRDELTIQDGLIFKGERLVVPASARQDMQSKIHASHIGIQSCLRRARESLYWPGMNREIEQYISRCDTCNSQSQAQAREPMVCHEVPVRPWEKIAIDLFEVEGKDYAVTIDYYSSFFEVDRLNAKTAKEVIGKMKSHLARHGIPDQVMSDNGQPFASVEFKNFANQYGFEHITSSPGYPQSNGKAESAVKTAKNLIKKAIASKSDPHLALLDWRNTPSEELKTSPVQRLFGRRTKTLLPTSAELLKPKTPKDVYCKLKLQKAKQAQYYDRGTKELENLLPGDTVRLQPNRKRKLWKKGRVEAQVGVRSYNVQTEDGGLYRRNRRHLRCTNEKFHPLAEECVDQPTVPNDEANYEGEEAESPQCHEQPQTTAEPSSQAPVTSPDSTEPQNQEPVLTPEKSYQSSSIIRTTCSGRVVRRPSRYLD